MATINIYNSFKKKLMDANISLSTDTIKVALVSSSYVVNIDTHQFFSDITGEVSGTGYTAGGATLAGKTTTQDNSNDRGVWDANDVTWTGSVITARGAVVYKSTGTASTSPLICFIDFGGDQATNMSTFQINWNDNGILYD
jgi:hypothetical protein